MIGVVAACRRDVVIRQTKDNYKGERSFDDLPKSTIDYIETANVS